MTKDLDHVVFHELSMIEKIIQDETWLEGERRGCYVPPSDIVVRANVCIVVLRIGAEVREAAMKKIAEVRRQESLADPDQVHHRAA
jgi:hypothetical protein